MSMITKCPACATAFRVTPQQLQAQHGMVRCGRCATVFDGFRTLAMQPDGVAPSTHTAPAAVRTEPLAAPPVAPPVAAPAAATDSAPAVAPAVVVPPAVSEESAPQAVPETVAIETEAALTQMAVPVSTSEPAIVPATPAVADQPEPVAPPAAAAVVSPIEPAAETALIESKPTASQAETPDSFSPQPALTEEALTPSAAGTSEPEPSLLPVVQAEADTPEAETAPAPAAAPATDMEPLLSPPPAPQPGADAAPVFGAAPLPRRRSGGLVFASLLLLLGLTAQAVYLYRGEIAARVPETRPYLDSLCGQLRCTVALPQRPQQIQIAASDIQATDPANPGRMVVTATLRSEAATAVGYPALDLVLTNSKDHTVARRIFLPSEYLGAGRDARAGIAPSAEVTISLEIETGDLGASGFRLDVLAAPTS